MKIDRWWIIGPATGVITIIVINVCIRVVHLGLFESVGIAVILAVLVMTVIRNAKVGR